jgi:7,8-dihydropterin-6-yl-methyl-4-(beta-D-ribofuranosyl)aminobenzene 5'-phosphate synthase
MTVFTTLIENSPGEHHGLKTEHGISFHIRKDGHSFLFDTGQSGAFLHNAAAMRIDLSTIDSVVLSHGHYDHTGGFRSLCGIAPDLQLHVGAGFFEEKYAVRGGAHDFLGNDFDETFLRDRKISYRSVTEETEEIHSGVFILSSFPRLHPDEIINPRFLLRKDQAFVPDRFDDEIMLAVDTPRGLVVMLGCSHPGMKNMLDAAEKRLGRPLYAVLGGTHLVESKGQGLESSLSYLNRNDIGVVGVSHCTGKEAIGRLQAENSGFFHNVTGSSLFVE